MAPALQLVRCPQGCLAAGFNPQNCCSAQDDFRQGCALPENHLTSTAAPASVNFFLMVSASSLETFSLIGLGAPSTRSLASFKPKLVTSRTALITLIFSAPAAVRTTVNSVFSSAGAAAAAAPPPATITGAAAAAETPRRSSSFFTRLTASNRLNPTICSSNCCKSAIVFLHFSSVFVPIRRPASSRSIAPRPAPRESFDSKNPLPLDVRTNLRPEKKTGLAGSSLAVFLELFLLHGLIDYLGQVASCGIHNRDQALRRSINQEQ